MAIFSRKSKPKKGDDKSNNPQPTEDKPKSEPYRHVPRHAASDAGTIGLTSVDRRDEQQRIMAASQQRLSNNKPDFATKNPPFSRADSHYAMHSTPSPSSYAGQQRQSLAGSKGYGTQGMPNRDLDVPPRAVSPILNTDRTGQIGRNHNDYFAQRDNPSPSFDSPTLGKPKSQAAARDRGYGNPHLSSDSGYGSAAQSRAPSEVNAPQEASQSRPTQSTGGFLPELSLSEELAHEPAFSERSFLEDPPLELPPTGQTRQRTSSNASNYVSRLDPGADTAPLKSTKSKGSTKSTKSTTKQTRFEEPLEPVPRVPAQYERQSSQVTERQGREPERSENVAHPRNRYVQKERSSVHSAAAHEELQPREPQPRFAQPARHSTPPLQSYEEPRHGFSQPMRTSTPPSTLEREAAPQPQFAAPARNSTPPPARRTDVENFTSQSRHSTPAPPGAYPQLVTSPAPSKRSTLPPLTILDGFKVNKRGKILDEEGDPIGELIEGDIIDCVRHKANAYGEVLDDFGGVVGHVRAIPRGISSPMTQSASPAPVMHQMQNADQFYQRPTSQQHPISPIQATQERESAYYQPDSQQYFHQIRGQEHIVSPRPHSLPQPSMSSLDYPLNITRAELDGSGHAEAPPIIDHSEIFAVPFVPSRSPKRASPSYSDSSANLNEQNQFAQDESRETTPEEHIPRRWASREFEFEPEDDDDEPTPTQRTPQPQYNTSTSQPQYTQSTPKPQYLTPGPAPAQSQTPRQARPSLPRSSTSGEPSKSTMRPAMGSMPEDSVPDSLQDENPALYSYRGEVPSMDGAAADSRIIPPQNPGAKSAPLPSFPRTAFTTALPAGSPFAPMNSAQFSSAGGMGPRKPAVQFSTGIPGPRPTANSKNSYHQPIRKSPLASQEPTPHESDEGNSDDGVTTPQPPGSYSRAASVRTTNSTATAKTAKSRTYFTHGGRVTVNGNQPPPSQNTLSVPGANDPKADAASMKSGKSGKSGSKKSRFSFGFGKKEQPVSAF